MDISDITTTDLQDDIIAPIIINEYRERLTKRMIDVAYMNFLSIYASSIVQDFESFLRTEVDLVEDDIRLVLDEYNSSFFTYEKEPGVYKFNDLSETLFNILQSQYPASSCIIDIEFDDITRKTKLVVRSIIIAIQFDEKSFFGTILGFTSGWDHKHYIEYISQSFVNLSTTNQIHLECDCINGFIFDRVQ